MINIMTEMGVALQFNEQHVAIHILPIESLTDISFESALHLFKLIQKRNFVYKDYQKKWSPFWRNLTQIERTMTNMFLNQNTYGNCRHFSFLNHENLPQEFLDVKMSSKLSKISSNIKDELEAIYKTYTMATVDNIMVKDYWENHYHVTSNLLKENGVFQELVENCYDEDFVKTIMHQELIGKQEWLLSKYNWDINDYGMFLSLINNEIGLFTGTPYLLTK